MLYYHHLSPMLTKTLKRESTVLNHIILYLDFPPVLQYYTNANALFGHCLLGGW